ncbi:MAG: hypothetical protein HYT77_03460 [Deltaproteobacteria bacterium]|nr:hypothetical protein [Deltaproteobacteria bacterium]
MSQEKAATSGGWQRAADALSRIDMLLGEGRVQPRAQIHYRSPRLSSDLRSLLGKKLK